MSVKSVEMVKLSYMMVVLILLAALSAGLVAARPSALTKKPPFNGSIFGKRSNLAPISPPVFESSPDGSNLEVENYSAIWSSLDRQMQQQRDNVLLEAAINRCLAQQRDAIPVSLETINLCEELYSMVNFKTKYS